MSPEEIKAFAQGLMSGQSVWYVFMPVVAAGAAYIGSYCAERGKNRATKDDIGKITEAVEAARLEFSKQLEDLKAHHQLRLVASERRLQAHQEAFAKWSHLAEILGGGRYEEVTKNLADLKEWSRLNCLFLGQKGRKAVNDAISYITILLNLRNEHRRGDPIENGLELLKDWQEFALLGNVFLSEVHLPSMSQAELDELKVPPL